MWQTWKAQAAEEMDTSSPRPKDFWVPQFRVNSLMNMYWTFRVPATY